MPSFKWFIFNTPGTGNPLGIRYIYTYAPSISLSLFLMAISNTTDWSLTSPPHRDTLPKTLSSSSTTTVSFISVVSRSNRRYFLATASISPQIDSTSQIRVEDEENLNEFLRGLCKDRPTEALIFYQKAKNRPEFQPEQSTMNHLIRYLLRRNHWSKISLLSQDFSRFGVFPDKYTCSRLIGSYISARKFRMTDALLDIFTPEEEIAVWALEAAMKGYNKLHMYSSTISVYNRMKSAGVVPDSCCYYRIMDAYRKTGDTKKVVSLFYEFEKLKTVSPFSSRIYGVLCDSLGRSGRAFEALRFFKEMIDKGIETDKSMYSSLIRAFANIRDVKVAEELFEEAREKKMVKDPELFLKLVLMYVDEGLLEKTLDIVGAMKEVKIKVSDCIFCTIINGYSKKRGLTRTVKVYEELISSGCVPGQVTYASIISVYCRLGLYDEAEAVFSEMEEKGFVKCVVAYSSMISMYGKNGRLRDAMRLVAKMKERGCEPNVWVYNALMDMHGKVKDLRQVEKLWKEMKRRKVAPDKVSYTSIINAYSKAREFDECLRFYEEFRINGGVLDRAMAGIMVGVYSKSSRIDELVKLLQDMKSEGMALDVRLYRSAVNAVRDAGLQLKWFDKKIGSSDVLKSGLDGIQFVDKIQKQSGEYRVTAS